MLIEQMLAGLYKGKGSGDFDDLDYDPPDKFEHAEWTLVAQFAGDGDGQNVEVYESRSPARFWKVVALPTPDSVNEMVEGFALSTGSGSDVGQLAFAIARAIAEGMLGLADD
jgi:hypothetical protein